VLNHILRQSVQNTSILGSSMVRVNHNLASHDCSKNFKTVAVLITNTCPQWKESDEKDAYLFRQKKKSIFEIFWKHCRNYITLHFQQCFQLFSSSSLTSKGMSFFKSTWLTCAVNCHLQKHSSAFYFQKRYNWQDPN